MLYSRFRGSEATRYGSLMVTSPDNPWLAASPDDKVHDPSATSANRLKNPHSAKHLTVLDYEQLNFLP